jgi:glycosyltransferase involved in cell wall biosynthesis
MTKNGIEGLVSIVMPTYNRERFIQIAFDSLRSQTYTNWELIIIDDGSSDKTEQLIEVETKKTSNSVKYIKQNNSGPAIARNRGIDLASGEFIAFFDSDDQWLPHHLKDSIDAMLQHPTISWVYSACRRINTQTQNTILESTFYTSGQANPLFSLHSHRFGDLYIIDDDNAAAVQIFDGIDSGLQNSVMRSHIFSNLRLPPFRIGEDRLFIVMALKHGFTLAFIDNIHVLYNVHDGNTSDTVNNDDRYERRIDSMQRLMESYDRASEYAELNKNELSVLNKRLALDYFWKLGFSLQWQSGNYADALVSYRKALTLQPFAVSMWKSYLVALVKLQFLKSKR